MSQIIGFFSWADELLRAMAILYAMTQGNRYSSDRSLQISFIEIKVYFIFL